MTSGWPPRRLARPALLPANASLRSHLAFFTSEKGGIRAIGESRRGFLGGTPLIVNDVLARMPSSSHFLPRMVNSGKADWEEMPFS